jgi:ribosomal protein L31
MTPLDLVEYVLHEDDDYFEPGMTSKMEVHCQQCGKHYKDKPCFPGEEGVSHGICPTCFPVYMDEIRKMKSQVYGREMPAYSPKETVSV